MTLRIDENDEVSVGVVNKKLESFVEIVMKSLIEHKAEIKKLKEKIKALEKGR